ncbi:MAG: hypothetical protein WCG48_00045 [Candidatus Berkelbacteria bacterium]
MNTERKYGMDAKNLNLDLESILKRIDKVDCIVQFKEIEINQRMLMSKVEHFKKLEQDLNNTISRSNPLISTMTFGNLDVFRIWEQKQSMCGNRADEQFLNILAMLEDIVSDFFIKMVISMSKTRKILNRLSIYFRNTGSAEFSDGDFKNFYKQYREGKFKDFDSILQAVIERTISPWVVIRFVRNSLKENSRLDFNISNGTCYICKFLDVNNGDNAIKECELINESQKYGDYIKFNFNSELFHSLLLGQNEIITQLKSAIIGRYMSKYKQSNVR